jgi:hypothetical protein
MALSTQVMFRLVTGGPAAPRLSISCNDLSSPCPRHTWPLLPSLPHKRLVLSAPLSLQSLSSLLLLLYEPALEAPFDSPIYPIAHGPGGYTLSQPLRRYAH